MAADKVQRVDNYLEKEMENTEKPETKHGIRKKKIGFYIGIGVAIGAGVGTAIGNMGVGIGAGMAIGAGIGFALKKKQKG